MISKTAFLDTFKELSLKKISLIMNYPQKLPSSIKTIFSKKTFVGQKS